MKISLILVLSLSLSSLAALAQTTILYEEDWGSTNSGSSLASVGWSQIPPPTTWSGTFARWNSDGSNGQLLPSNSLYFGGNDAGLEFFYTTNGAGAGTHGDSAFTSIDPGRYTNLEVLVECQWSLNGGTITNWIAVQVGGNWYVETNEPLTTAEHGAGSVYYPFHFSYNPAASNWTSLVLSSKLLLGGPPASDLSGAITGIGVLMHLYTNGGATWDFNRIQIVSVSNAAATTPNLAASPVMVADASLTEPKLGGPQLPKLKVSENKHFLVTESGEPFFWLGDTGWELFHRLTREEADRYLRNRAAKGFTVIQAVIFPSDEWLPMPNAYGELPFQDDDPAKPNDQYFKNVDWIVKRANSLGLYVGLLPTWGTRWCSDAARGTGVFTPENAAAYGEWLGRRYRDCGLVWILGGDRPIATERHRAIIDAMARGLRQGDGGSHLITFHPWGHGGSSEWLQSDPLFDFNLRQNGHNPEYTDNHDQTRADYDRQPAKPVIDAEPMYEDHPIALEATKHGYSVAADVRRILYWDLFGGACGHTYGDHAVWQFWAPPREPINSPLKPWYEAMDAPGAFQMQYGKQLLLSRPFLTRVPDDSIIIPDVTPTSVPGAGLHRFVATRDSEGRYAMVYVPVGKTFSVRTDCIRGSKIKAWWFNPRSGKANLIGDFSNDGQLKFTPPEVGEAVDWVLVLDDAAMQFPPPGALTQVER